MPPQVLPGTESEEGGGHGLQGEAVEHLRWQHGVPRKRGRDQLTEPCPGVPGTGGKNLGPGLRRILSQIRNHSWQYNVNVGLGTNNAFRYHRGLGGHDHGCATDRGCFLLTIGAQELQLVVGLTDVAVRDHAGRFLVALGLDRKP